MAERVITLRIPERDLELVDHYVDNGDFASRSELIRQALKTTLSRLLLEDVEARHLLGRDGKPMAGALASLHSEETARTPNRRGRRGMTQ